MKPPPSTELEEELDVLIARIGIAYAGELTTEVSMKLIKDSKQAFQELITKHTQEARIEERRKVRVRIRYQLKAKGINPEVIKLARPLTITRPKTTHNEIEELDKALSQEGK